VKKAKKMRQRITVMMKVLPQKYLITVDVALEIPHSNSNNKLLSLLEDLEEDLQVKEIKRRSNLRRSKNLMMMRNL
jgi:hypothetical protein